MNEAYCAKISTELGLVVPQVMATIRLFDEGGTVPFISRYRKEVTGGLDETQIIGIRDRMEQLLKLNKRREAILKSIEEQGKLTDELKQKVQGAETLARLEDIYLPYKPKRRTRATTAKEKGLLALAVKVFEQGDFDLEAEAALFVDEEKGVKNEEEALAGARDIMAEWINENADARAELRRLFSSEAIISSKVVEGQQESGMKYKDYFDWEEPAHSSPSHRILAIRRGAAEGFLTFRILPSEDKAVKLLEHRFVKNDNSASEQVRQALQDGYKRLLSASMETEIRLETKIRADEEAIKVFGENLRNLLLASPLGQKAVLGLDPGFRSGCKIVCLDPQGKLLQSAVIFPLEPQKKIDEAGKILKEFVTRFDLEAIAVGNGTGGREAEAFCRKIDFGRSVTVMMVNESGASIYSASKVAREEFPEHDVTVRGCVSIGRRLMDPLSELVKIDPKSIGVGQYQHDVNQKAMKRALDDVVVSCVNAVGVEVNTAGKQLMGYVSGLSERLAWKIVEYRNEHGAFRSRTEFMNVPGMGGKTFEQAAGFLRIRGAENPLDASAVHPESYSIVDKMAADADCSVGVLVRDRAIRSKVSLESYVTDSVGMPTLTDIMEELAKPGRDPREKFEVFAFADGINKISDLEVGMQLSAVVTNVTAFGAFVDIGVHQDGLVHVSELTDGFVHNTHEAIKVHQKVTVTVIGVDLERKRISLSMRKDPLEQKKRPPAKQASRPKKTKERKKDQDREKPPPANNPFAELLKNWKG